MIDTADFFREKLDYAHSNPMQKGFIEQAEHWRYFPHQLNNEFPRRKQRGNSTLRD
jgi:hypothetical protein